MGDQTHSTELAESQALARLVHVRAIFEFLDAHNADPKPFVWTKSAEEILASIARFGQRTADTQAAQLMSRTTVTGH